jgi:excisionase family DNA binding protein
MTTGDPQELLAVGEVAGIFRVDVRTIWRWIENAIIRKVVRIGGVVRIPRSEVDRLLRGG